MKAIEGFSRASGRWERRALSVARPAAAAVLAVVLAVPLAGCGAVSDAANTARDVAGTAVDGVNAIGEGVGSAVDSVGGAVDAAQQLADAVASGDLSQLAGSNTTKLVVRDASGKELATVTDRAALAPALVAFGSGSWGLARDPGGAGDLTVEVWQRRTATVAQGAPKTDGSDDYEAARIELFPGSTVVRLTVVPVQFGLCFEAPSEAVDALRSLAG